MPIAPLLDGEQHDAWFAICARLDDADPTISGRLHLRLSLSGLDPSSEAYAIAAQAGGGAFDTDALTLMSRLGFATPKGAAVKATLDDELGTLGVFAPASKGPRRSGSGAQLGAGPSQNPPMVARSSSSSTRNDVLGAGPASQLATEQVASAEARRRMETARKGARPQFLGTDLRMHKQLKPVQPKERLVAKLRVSVLEATGLVALDKNGTSDPYVVVQLGESKLRTTTHQQTLNPVWGEPGVGEGVEFELDALDESTVMHAVVFDWNRTATHRFMGEVVLFVAQLAPNELHDLTYNLQHGDPGQGEVSGTLRMLVELMLPLSGGGFNASVPASPRASSQY